MAKYKIFSDNYKYTTPHPREPKEYLYISPSAQVRNDEFLLKFLFPKLKTFSKKQSDIVILINGFAEYNAAVYNRIPSKRQTDSIGSHLAKKHGIASVLLPLPFHLTRFCRKDYKRDDWPKDILTMILRKKERFWYGFNQMIDDIEKLVNLIRRQDDEFFSKYFDKDTRIHLLGYSMGGLGALSYQLHALAPDRVKCNSLILLSSGGNLQSLVPDEFKKLKPTEWKKFVQHFLKDAFTAREDVDADSAMYRVFRRVVAGEHDELVHTLLELEVNNTLVVLGGNDRTNRYQWVLPNDEPDDSDTRVTTEKIPLFHTLIIPYLEHSLLSSSWKRNQSYVIDTISNFIKTENQFLGLQ